MGVDAGSRRPARACDLLAFLWGPMIPNACGSFALEARSFCALFCALRPALRSISQNYFLQTFESKRGVDAKGGTRTLTVLPTGS